MGGEGNKLIRGIGGKGRRGNGREGKKGIWEGKGSRTNGK